MCRPIALAFLSLALIGAGCDPDSVLVPAVPVSGIWNFEMYGAWTNLGGPSCPSGAAVTLANGEADLSVADDGERATMFVDNHSIVFYRQNDGSYKSTPRMFSARHSVGEVYFEFVADVDDAISGTLHWNNNAGCSGAYPFTMGLIETFLPGDATTETITLSQGQWVMSLSDEANDCSGEVVGFTSMPNDVTITHNINLDTGAPDPASITIEPLGAILDQVPETNVYTQASGGVDVGLPVDAAGDVLLDYESTPFEATFELTAESPTSATGTVYISGSSCGMTASVSMTFVGS